MKSVNKLKAGSNNPEDLEFLKNLKASDFNGGGVLDNGTNSENEILIKWNALQKTPGKRRNFTFMEIRQGSRLTHYLPNAYPEGASVKWAWIYHNQDSSEHKHYHFYIEYKNPRSFTSVANELQLPVTNLQAVLDKKAILQYLTHENAPDKHHYDKEEIHANFDVIEESTDKLPNIHEEYEDWKAVRAGQMSIHEFFDKYMSDCATLRFNDRLRMYDRSLHYDK